MQKLINFLVSQRDIESVTVRWKGNAATVVARQRHSGQGFLLHNVGELGHLIEYLRRNPEADGVQVRIAPPMPDELPRIWMASAAKLAGERFTIEDYISLDIAEASIDQQALDILVNWHCKLSDARKKFSKLYR